MSTTDQVTLLCHDIEDSLQAGEKAGAVFLDLTAAYDTVWLRGLHMKLLETIPDKHLVGFIMELLSNRSFRLHTSNGQSSRVRRLRNGVPQGSVLAPMLFNIYIYDLPLTTSRKYGYADDLAILLSRASWEAVEEGLTEDMNILSSYLKDWRLKLSVDKTVATMFHLYNREATREPNIMVDNARLQSQSSPTYLGVKLDRTLSFKQHARLDGAYTKLLMRIKCLSWKRHPTIQQIYGDLPRVSTIVKSRRLQFAGHCQRATNEVASSFVLWRPKPNGRRNNKLSYPDILSRDSGITQDELYTSV